MTLLDITTWPDLVLWVLAILCLSTAFVFGWLGLMRILHNRKWPECRTREDYTQEHNVECHEGIEYCIECGRNAPFMFPCNKKLKY